MSKEDRIKKMVYASTRYDEPKKSPNYPVPSRVDREIEKTRERQVETIEKMESEIERIRSKLDNKIDELAKTKKQHEDEIKMLQGKKEEVQDDLSMIQNLTEDDIRSLSKRVRQWLGHAMPKYQDIIDKIELEEEEN